MYNVFMYASIWQSWSRLIYISDNKDDYFGLLFLYYLGRMSQESFTFYALYHLTELELNMDWIGLELNKY